MKERKLQDLFCWGVSDNHYATPALKGGLFHSRDRTIEEISAYLTGKCRMSSDEVHEQLLNLNSYGYADVDIDGTHWKRVYLLKCNVTKGLPIATYDDLLVRGV